MSANEAGPRTETALPRTPVGDHKPERRGATDWLPYGALFLCQLGYCVWHILAKKALNNGLSPYVLALYREVGACACMLGLAHLVDGPALRAAVLAAVGGSTSSRSKLADAHALLSARSADCVDRTATFGEKGTSSASRSDEDTTRGDIIADDAERGPHAPSAADSATHREDDDDVVAVVAPTSEKGSQQGVPRFRRRDRYLLVVLGLLGFGNIYGFIVALSYVTSFNSALLHPTIPVVSAGVAALFGVERATTATIAGVALGAAGAGIVVAFGVRSDDETEGDPMGGSRRRILVGNLYLVGQCVCMGALLVVQKSLATSTKTPPTTLTLMYNVVATAVAVVATLVLAGPPGSSNAATYRVDSPEQLVAVLYGAVVGICGIYVLLGWATVRAGPTVVALSMTLQPPLNAVLSVMFMGRDTFTVGEILGGLLIAVGLVVAVAVGGPSRRGRTAVANSTVDDDLDDDDATGSAPHTPLRGHAAHHGGASFFAVARVEDEDLLPADAGATPDGSWAARHSSRFRGRATLGYAPHPSLSPLFGPPGSAGKSAPSNDHHHHSAGDEYGSHADDETKVGTTTTTTTMNALVTSSPRRRTAPPLNNYAPLALATAGSESPGGSDAPSPAAAGASP